MNGKIKAFYESQGMTVEKNKAYGIVRGYETNASIVDTSWEAGAYGDTNYPYRVFVAFYATSEQKQKIENALRNAALKYFKFRIDDCGLEFSYTGMTTGAMAKRLPELFDFVFGTITENGGKTHEFCPFCGAELQEGNYKRCNVNGKTITLELSCVDKINAVIAAENEEFKAAPNNILRGLAGALIGGLAGAVVEAVLLYIGYVAFLSAIVSVVLGAFLYQKFGGKPTKIMLVIVGAVTLVFMALTVFLMYFIIIAEGSMEMFMLAMEIEEVSNAFTMDMILALVFAVVGIIIEIVLLARTIRRNKGIN